MIKKFISITILWIVVASLLANCSFVNRNIPELQTLTASSKPAITQTYSLRPTSTYTPEPTSTFTPTASPTITSIPKLYKLSFQAFHDYNGNGEMNEGEPALEGILNHTTAGSCTTCFDGRCDIVNVISGRYHISILDKRDVATHFKMRYLLPTVSEVLTLGQGFNILVDGDKLVNEPLGQGFLTWPLSCENKGKVSEFFDILNDPSCRNWNMQLRGGCYNGHQGVDIDGKIGWVIIAPAPGTVKTGHNNRGALWVDVKVVNSDLTVSLGHNKENLVSTGDKVKRGQPIAILGNTGTVIPHIHLAVFGHGVIETGIDPFRDLLNPNSISLWTLDNEPECLPSE